MFTSEFRVAVIAATGATLTAAVVACAPGTSMAAPLQPAGDHDAFTQCLTDNGVPAPPDGGPGGPGGHGGPPPGGPPPNGGGPPGGAMPPPGPGGPRANGQTPPAPPGVDQQTWDNATQACASLAPHPPAPA